MLKLIKNDMFDICRQIKEYDKNYLIYFNTSIFKFELHNTRKKPTLQLVLPFDRLDTRTLSYVLKTRIERMKKELMEIDEFNEKLKASKQNVILDELQYKSKQVANYMFQGGENIPSYENM
ncbi:MAG: hypothetical protein RR123_05930 [Clostridia bacterium]